MTRIPYCMTMPTVTADDIQAIRKLSTDQLARALASTDLNRAHPLALVEAQAELACRRPSA